MTPWFVYIAVCGDESLYTGTAVDVPARLAAHAVGRGARYTRGRGPIRLGAKTRCESQGEALRLELAIKALPRAEKLRLVDRPGRLPAFARKWRTRTRP
jgi:predicted GIY-YIG superfamily endonuclease